MTRHERLLPEGPRPRSRPIVLRTESARRRTVSPPLRPVVARAWLLQLRQQCADAPAQLVIDLPHLASSLELIGSHTEACQDRHENEAVPKLQPPAYGFEKHAQA